MRPQVCSREEPTARRNEDRQRGLPTGAERGMSSIHNQRVNAGFPAEPLVLRSQRENPEQTERETRRARAVPRPYYQITKVRGTLSSRALQEHGDPIDNVNG